MDEGDDSLHASVLLALDVLLHLLGHRQFTGQAILFVAAPITHQLVYGSFILGCLLLGAEQAYQFRGECLGQFVVRGRFGLDERVELLLIFGFVLGDGEEADIDALVELGAPEVDGDWLGDLDIYLILFVGVAHLEDCPGCPFLLE